MCNFYHVYPGAETEGFSFFWFSFRSVTIFYMLRGLLRLGVLPGVRGGTVPGRGEGKVYEVARNVGEVSGEWLQQQRQKMPHFRREIKTWRKNERRPRRERRNIFELQLFFLFLNIVLVFRDANTDQTDMLYKYTQWHVQTHTYTHIHTNSARARRIG